MQICKGSRFGVQGSGSVSEKRECGAELTSFEGYGMILIV